MNRQRQVIYEQRKKVLKGENLREDIEEMLEEVAENLVDDYIDEKSHPEDWNLKAMDDMIFKQFALKTNYAGSTLENLNKAIITDDLINAVKNLLKNKEAEFGPALMEYLIKVIGLQTIDTHWKDNLLSMDHLKEGIGLRGYGQKDPVREYQKEGYDMFMDMVYRIKEDTLEKLCMVRIQKEEEIEEMQSKQKQDYTMNRGEDVSTPATVKRTSDKVGRNDPCPCGRGKKYKKCCGQG
jgi:preprotein translocase subunit SecA